MQLKGHVVTTDRQHVGVVEDVSTVQVPQSDVPKMRYDPLTGHLKRYQYEDGAPVMESVPPMDCQCVHVRWEDGTETWMTETVDQWEVLGSVKVVSSGETDPDVLASVDRANDRALGDVAAYAAELRAAPAMPVTDDDSPGEDVVVVVRDRIGGTSNVQ
jgi:hypothetical protein